MKYQGSHALNRHFAPTITHLGEEESVSEHCKKGAKMSCQCNNGGKITSHRKNGGQISMRCQNGDKGRIWI